MSSSTTIITTTTTTLPFESFFDFVVRRYTPTPPLIGRVAPYTLLARDVVAYQRESLQSRGSLDQIRDFGIRRDQMVTLFTSFDWEPNFNLRTLDDFRAASPASTDPLHALEIVGSYRAFLAEHDEPDDVISYDIITETLMIAARRELYELPAADLVLTPRLRKLADLSIEVASEFYNSGNYIPAAIGVLLDSVRDFLTVFSITEMSIREREERAIKRLLEILRRAIRGIEEPQPEDEDEGNHHLSNIGFEFRRDLGIEESNLNTPEVMSIINSPEEIDDHPDPLGGRPVDEYAERQAVMSLVAEAVNRINTGRNHQ